MRELKDEVVTTRLTLTERRLVEAVAAKQGRRALSGFVRESLLRRVREELALPEPADASASPGA